MFFQSLLLLGIEVYVSNIAISFYRNIVRKNIVCDVGLKFYFFKDVSKRPALWLSIDKKRYFLVKNFKWN